MKDEDRRDRLKYVDNLETQNVWNGKELESDCRKHDKHYRKQGKERK